MSTSTKASRSKFSHRHKGHTLNLVEHEGTTALHFDGHVNGLRVRGSSRVTLGDLRTAEGRAAAKLAIERKVDDVIRKQDGGMVTIAARAVATEDGLTLGEAFDLFRERVMPELTLSYRKNLDKTMRLFEATWGRTQRLKLLQQSDVKNHVAARVERRIDMAAAQPPEYIWPHPTARCTPRREAGPTTVKGDFLNLVAVFGHLSGIKDSKGNYILPVSPLRGLKFPDGAAPLQQRTSDDRYQRMLAVADEAERATLRRRNFEAKDWTAGAFRMMLVLYRRTGRRQNAVRLLQREDIILDPGEAQRIAERLAPHDAEMNETIHYSWPCGAIIWRGAKSKRTRGRQKPDEIVPMGRELRAEVEAYLDRMPNKNPKTFLFVTPRPRTSTLRDKPEYLAAVDRKAQRDWFLRMEELAGLPHRKGGVWHAFRRLFRTERERFNVKVVNRCMSWSEGRRHTPMERHYHLVLAWKMFLCMDYVPTREGEAEDDVFCGGQHCDVDPGVLAAYRAAKTRRPVALVA